MSVTLTDLPDIVRQLTPHISPDDTLPTLGGIYLEATGTHLFAAATDRYTFALARREAPETSSNGPWSALIARADLTALKALFTGRRRHTELTLIYDPAYRNHAGWLTVSDGNRSLRLSANAPDAARFPKWRPLFADALTAEPQLTDEAHYNAAFLARWAHAPNSRYEPLTLWSAGPNKPLLIAAGHDFLGLQMPVRLDKPKAMAQTRERHDRTALRTTWTDTLNASDGNTRRLKAA